MKIIKNKITQLEELINELNLANAKLKQFLHKFDHADLTYVNTSGADKVLRDLKIKYAEEIIKNENSQKTRRKN